MPAQRPELPWLTACPWAVTQPASLETLMLGPRALSFVQTQRHDEGRRLRRETRRPGLGLLVEEGQEKEYGEGAVSGHLMLT